MSKNIIQLNEEAERRYLRNGNIFRKADFHSILHFGKNCDIIKI